MHRGSSLEHIIYELREELAFIKEELSINVSGPCTVCHRRWFTSPRTGKLANCNICDVTLCPTCPKNKCTKCGSRVCNSHLHKCDFCAGFCKKCVVKCEVCGEICRNVAGNMCDYPDCTSCPKHSPLHAIDDDVYLCREHNPIETVAKEDNPKNLCIKDFL